MYTSLYRHSLRNHHIRAIINLVTADSLIALQIFHYNRLSTFSGRLPTGERRRVCRAIRDEACKEKKKRKKNREKEKSICHSNLPLVPFLHTSTHTRFYIATATNMYVTY